MTVKKEKDIFKHNLIEDDYSYVHYLHNKYDEIAVMYENRSVSVDQYKEYLRRITAEAKDTEKKRAFLLELARQRTKYDILKYATDIIMKGQGLEVI